ncbi:MAG: hypothetical protein AVDCRST_MAG26-2581 [uncultured Chloroflexia bacterium]|uniref:Histidine kinase/HSP90-like ATPase domain-containing protein n=1 Tax=uncultured Chloroflexia bacterium TaxID=1672391 RepID=A0A6J4IZI1_9CHLR|nr:MAG: hypothetical protein AVDCRST_MAG26-2581 [uncultured Chloroflexia bacterium]
MKNAASLEVSAELSRLAEIRHFVAQQAANLSADTAMVDAVVLAANEAATNSIVHGYRGRSGTIQVEVGRVEDALVVRLRDHAPPFDPTCVPPPDITIPLHRRPPGGMGVHLTRQATDAMTYRVAPDGSNELTLLMKGLLDEPDRRNA